ncbi:MAG: SPFH domain-containing protein [Myxococcota bacterium]
MPNLQLLLLLIFIGTVGLYLLASLRYIPNDKVGIVEKRLSRKGSLRAGIIALHGEAGFEPRLLRGGLHFLPAIQYRVHRHPLVTIPQGRIGYVFARDGLPLPATQALASNQAAMDFQDVEAFLAAGGQRGPQRKILREGTYAINVAQFAIITDERVFFLQLDKGEVQTFEGMATLIRGRSGFRPLVIEGADDVIGIATVHDGASLSEGEIIAPVVGEDPAARDTFHNSFQDPERFLAAGGKRGRQLQVLVEGTYYLNRLFVTVEEVAKTIVDVGTVGVVVSYNGATGKDLSGEAYKHGELVGRGLRGVWSEPLLPGKYAFNTYAGKVFMVPTTNFILKWKAAETGSHKFDENLTEVALITKDAFEPSLPLSVVVHIDYRKAPLVIQRFGDIKKLVEQTLDPMVSAYFKNIGQTRTLIELLQDRSAIQELAGQQMKEKFAHYNLELQEVLIGTPAASSEHVQINTILTQLRSRQIAAEQIETYAQQEKAAVKERELREAESRARQQTQLTESELSISILTNQGKAELARAGQRASEVEVMAKAEAEKVRLLGEGEAKRVAALATAEANKVARVGLAQAMAIEEQVRAYGGPRFQLTQQVMNRFAEAIQGAGVDVVPKIMIHGSPSGERGGGSSGNVMEGLLAMLLADKMEAETTTSPTQGTRGRSEAEALKREILGS